MGRKGYLVSTIVTSLLEAAAIVAVVLWLLPLLGVNIPLWGLGLMLVAFGIYEGVTYRVGWRALGRKPVVSTQTMVGCYGRATTSLSPKGYVQVGGELWRALASGPDIAQGEEVIVVEVRRLTLLVAPLSGSRYEGEPE